MRTRQDVDPSFVSAVESRYLAHRARTNPTEDGRTEALDTLLASAIFEADPTNGGLRYRALKPEIRRELENRLVRYEPQRRS